MKYKIILIIMLVLVSGCSNINELEDYCEQEGITDDYCSFGQVKCYRMCKVVLNATNSHYDFTGFGSSECWCYRGGEPIQAY